MNKNCKNQNNNVEIRKHEEYDGNESSEMMLIYDLL